MIVGGARVEGVEAGPADRRVVDLRDEDRVARPARREPPVSSGVRSVVSSVATGRPCPGCGSCLWGRWRPSPRGCSASWVPATVPGPSLLRGTARVWHRAWHECSAKPPSVCARMSLPRRWSNEPTSSCRHRVPAAAIAVGAAGVARAGGAQAPAVELGSINFPSSAKTPGACSILIRREGAVQLRIRYRRRGFPAV